MKKIAKFKSLKEHELTLSEKLMINGGVATGACISQEASLTCLTVQCVWYIYERGKGLFVCATKDQLFDSRGPAGPITNPNPIYKPPKECKELL